MTLSTEDEKDIWDRLREGERKGDRMDERMIHMEKNQGEIKDDLKWIRRFALATVVLLLISVGKIFGPMLF